MQLDTNKKRLAAIFKSWQVPLVDELRTGRSMTSSEAHKFLADQDIRTKHPKSRGPVSRSAVINFFNHLVDHELLTYTEVSGRGGWGKRYEMTLTREEFAHKIINLFVSKLIEAFPEESKIFSWRGNP